MAYVVQLSGRAERQLAALPAGTQTRIVTALRKLALDPYRAANGKKRVSKVIRVLVLEPRRTRCNSMVGNL